MRFPGSDQVGRHIEEGRSTRLVNSIVTVNSIGQPGFHSQLGWSTQLVNSIGQLDWSTQLVNSIGQLDWSTRLVNSVGQPDWSTRLVNSIGQLGWSTRMVNLSSVSQPSWSTRAGHWGLVVTKLGATGPAWVSGSRESRLGLGRPGTPGGPLQILQRPRTGGPSKHAKCKTWECLEVCARSEKRDA